MEWIIATIVFAILLAILLSFVFVQMHLSKKKESASYDKGANDMFSGILNAGYSQKVSEFHLLNKHVEKGQVVLLGDSLTDNYPVNECFLNIPYKVYNRGIGGDTTEGLVKRLNESVFELEPSVVVLLIGINDFAMLPNTTSEFLASRIDNLIKQIKYKLPKTKIILEAIYPINKSKNPKIDHPSVDNKDNQIINETNELLKKIEEIKFLDLSSVLKDENGELNIEHTREGLHLNANGYFLITPYIEKAILDVLE